MTKQFGRNEDRLADMSIDPTLERYEHPPKEDCTAVVDQSMDLASTYVLHYILFQYDGRDVFMSIQISTRLEDKLHTLSRIDTAHGELHQHYYLRDGSYDPRRPRKVISIIPVDNPHTFIQNAYMDSYETLVNEAPIVLAGWST